MAISPLKGSYGDNVVVNYHDVSRSQKARTIVAAMERETGYPLPLPAVSINGRLVQEGWVSYYELGEIIERILKNGSDA
ncbi:MAG: hypothetical protein ACYC1U_10970 [Candidatus Aquicultorales bacterium]